MRAIWGFPETNTTAPAPTPHPLPLLLEVDPFGPGSRTWYRASASRVSALPGFHPYRRRIVATGGASDARRSRPPAWAVRPATAATAGAHPGRHSSILRSAAASIPPPHGRGGSSASFPIGASRGGVRETSLIESQGASLHPAGQLPCTTTASIPVASTHASRPQEREPPPSPPNIRAMMELGTSRQYGSTNSTCSVDSRAEIIPLEVVISPLTPPHLAKALEGRLPMAAKDKNKCQPKKTDTGKKKGSTGKPQDDFGGSTQSRTKEDTTDINRLQRQEE